MRGEQDVSSFCYCFEYLAQERCVDCKLSIAKLTDDETRQIFSFRSLPRNPSIY